MGEVVEVMQRAVALPTTPLSPTACDEPREETADNDIDIDQVENDVDAWFNDRLQVAWTG